MNRLFIVPVAAALIALTTCCAGKIAAKPDTPDVLDQVKIPPLPQPGAWDGSTPAAWAEVDRLIDNQQVQAALDKLGEIEKSAVASGDARSQVRIIVRRMSMEMELDRWQEGLNHLLASEASWPGDLVSQTTLGLYLAETIRRYKANYSWEIAQRPERSDADQGDVKTWSARQLNERATATLFRLWTWREALATVKTKVADEFLIGDTFPAGVRDTFADAVAYRLADLLADSETWTVDQTNDVWKLKCADMTVPAARSALTAYPEGVHPLMTMSVILRDLEALKTARGQREGALEARLQMVRLIATHASGRKGWNEHLVEHLSKRLESETGHDWWSTGMALLARLTRELGKPDSQVAAMEVIRKCVAGKPGTNGAGECADIAKEIEARQLWNFSAPAAGAIGAKTLSVESRNVDHLWFRAWKVDYAALVNDPGVRNPDEEISIRYRDREKLPKPDITWEEKLDFPKDYQSRGQMFVPPVSEKGTWVVQVSANQGFTRENNMILTVVTSLGGPVVSVETIYSGKTATFKVLDGDRGNPLQGARIRLFRQNWGRFEKPKTALGQFDTDQNGEVRMDRPTGGSGRIAGYVDQGGLTWPINLPYYFDDRYWRGSDWDTDHGVILTDRAIYRPGQKVLFKVMAYHKADDAKDLPWVAGEGRGFTIELRDTNWEVVASKKVTTNAWGTASGEFEIPEGRMLGEWTVAAGGAFQSRVKVEEYRVPSFTVEIDNPEGIRLNRQAEIKGGADYFFGLPVSGARAVWRVERQPIWPWWYFGGETAASVIASGTVQTDDKGRFNVSFLAEAEEVAAGETAPDYWFNLSVDVTDDAGETHSGKRSFRLGHSTAKAEARIDGRFFETREKVAIDLARSDINGNPAPGEVRWTLVRIAPPATTPLPSSIDTGGRLSSRIEGFPGWDRGEGWDWSAMVRKWPDGDRARDGTLTTDSKGAGSVDLGSLEAGLWRLRYSVVDRWGAEFKDSLDFQVVSPAKKTALPLQMSARQGTYEVGDTVRLAISSGFDNQYALLQMWDRSGEIDTRHLRLGPGTTILEYKVTKAMRGGLIFKLLAYHGYENLSLMDSVAVPWTDRLVDVAIETLRDRVTPGGRETVSLKVLEHGSKRGVPAAEVLSWMYDRSLDDIAPGYFPDLSGIWPGVSFNAQRTHNLGTGRTIWFDSEGFVHESVPWEQYEALDLKYLPRWNNYGGRVRSARGFRGIGMGGGGMATGAVLAETASMEKDEEAAPQGLAKSKAVAAPAMAPAPAGDKADRAEAKDGGPAAPAAEARSNFAETAFFKPHLLSGPDGSVTFEYEVPDSITTWKLLARALTKDLRSGSAQAEVISAKDLMVKPFLPRFLREGDSSVVTAVVANTTDKPMSGTVTIWITDPETGASLDREFSLLKNQAEFQCAPGSETTVRFEVLAPSKPGPTAFKIMATSGRLSDGEVRSVPVLPGRMHLMQSRFVTLHGKGGVDSRTMEFADMKSADPSRINEQLVVTVDGQLFMSVLKALPYLTEYPYECAEQTLNRFVSTGILSSLFIKYPGIAAMAKVASERDTQYMPWNTKDPNRKLSLEETPWLQESTGKGSDHVLKILDPKVAAAQKASALTRLKKMQQADGAFPWFPGGPPDAWMTMYIVAGFSRAMEFGVEVPADMLSRAISWTHNWYLEMLKRHRDWMEDDWYTATYLSWILWNLPPDIRAVFTQAEQRQMLNLAFDHWKDMSMGLKSMLAMTLHRAGRQDDAKLVWASVMDRARTEQDRGMFWAPEERSWLWYNDTIENHARAIRTLEELDPGSKSIDDLVLWLFINKKLNHWKSTRATAEVVYALARHMDATGEIGGREVISVAAGDVSKDFVFDPAKSADTTAQLVIPGPEVDNAKMSKVTVSKQTPGWAMASATWHFSTEKMPEKGEGDLLKIDRLYFLKKKTQKGVELEPLTDTATLAPGDEVEVQVSIKSGEPIEYVHLRDPRPAGFEPATQNSGYRWDLGIWWYEEVRDSGENFFFERLPRGEYTFRYTIRAALAGTFKAAPATIQPMYAPEFAAYSAGRLVTITGR